MEPVKIYIPQPGHVNPVLCIIIDHNDDILFRLILHHCRNVLVKSCRVLRQIQHDLCAVNLELLHPPVLRMEPGKHLVKVHRLDSPGPEGCIGRQDIIHVVKSLIVCMDPFSFYSKGKCLAHLHVSGVKVKLRTFEIAVCAGIVSKLTIMIEIIMEKSSAFFTETPLPDFIGFAVVCHLFADAVGRIRIAAVHRKKCGQRVVSVDDHLHLRRAFHDFF